MPVCSTAGHLRIGRFSEPGRIYLITAVVHQRQPFFADWCLGRLVVKQLREAEDEGCADFLTWVVMPDHMHCLLQLKGKTLAEGMCRTNPVAVWPLIRRWGDEGGYGRRAITIERFEGRTPADWRLLRPNAARTERSLRQLLQGLCQPCFGSQLTKSSKQSEYSPSV